MAVLESAIFTLLLALLHNRGPIFPSADAASVLSHGERLDSFGELVSDGGDFTLGFFTVQDRDDPSHYLGIWYTNDQARTVWVANPNTPLPYNTSGTLTIDSYGTLKIIINGGGGESIVIFNGSDHARTTRDTKASLKDSGNFVVVDGSDNRTLWQSFDHPGNTFLPGMRLGFNATTSGENSTLVSWVGDEVPASGAFTLGLERVRGSGQLVIRRRGELYWTSGPWKDEGFQLAPALSENRNFSFASGKDAMYLSFDGSGGAGAMLELTAKGQIYDVVNHRMLSPYQDFCYGYESSEGCVASSSSPSCMTSGEKFEYRNISLDGLWQSSDENSSLSLGDCMDMCWKNCSCVAFRTTYGGSAGCKMWGTSETFSLDTTGSFWMYVLVSKDQEKGGGPGVKPRLWKIMAPTLFLVLLASSLFGYIIRRRRRLRVEEKRRRDFLEQLSTTDSFNEDVKGRKKRRDLKMFSFESITAATDNFSGENKLGEGGFGPVYKGRLPDGQEVAVKRLSRTSGQGVMELNNELVLISKLQHTNLVRVLGCCIHQEEKMLVYEFMPNKSLDFFLFSPERRKQLDWHTRFKIMEGVAQGLLYLHKHSRMKVIHRDLKASNILLDGDMSPKIADFGMARIFRQNEAEVITRKVVGTYGYMSPEYAMTGTCSVKSDVFSFGVLVLEIVSGRRNTSFYNLRPLNLIGYAWELWQQGNVLDLKDDALVGESFDAKQISRAIHIGLLCVQENARDRPKMQDVTAMLNSKATALPSPNKAAYFAGRNIPKTQNSLQDFIITEVEPR